MDLVVTAAGPGDPGRDVVGPGAARGNQARAERGRTGQEAAPPDPPGSRPCPLRCVHDGPRSCQLHLQEGEGVRREPDVEVVAAHVALGAHRRDRVRLGRRCCSPRGCPR